MCIQLPCWMSLEDDYNPRDQDGHGTPKIECLNSDNF